MAVRYEVDAVAQRVIITHSGVVTNEEVRTVASWLWPEPLFDVRLPVLVDGRDVTAVAADNAVIREFAELPLPGPRGRMAVLTSPGVVYGVARMWAAYYSGGGEVAVFQDRSATERWLRGGSAPREGAMPGAATDDGRGADTAREAPAPAESVAAPRPAASDDAARPGS